MNDLKKIDANEHGALDFRKGDLYLMASYKYDRHHRVINDIPYTICCLCQHDHTGSGNTYYNFVSLDGNARTITSWDWDEVDYDIYLYHRPTKETEFIHMAKAPAYIKKLMRNRKLI